MFNLDMGLLLDFVTIAIAIAGAYVLLRSKLCQQTQAELKELAEARKAKIDDQEARIKKLEEHLMKLEGRLEGVYAIKANEIAELVVAKIGEMNE